MSAHMQKKRVHGWEVLLRAGAGEVARAGDRWFVALAGDVAGAGRWARREADFIGDSMAAAFQTTVEVARKMSPGKGPGKGPAKGAADRASETGSQRPPNVTILTALNDVGVPMQVAESELTSHRAGIAPLLAALEELVSGRTEDGYESLQSDERFWALVELIHERGATAGTDGASEAAIENERSQ